MAGDIALPWRPRLELTGWKHTSSPAITVFPCSDAHPVPPPVPSSPSPLATARQEFIYFYVPAMHPWKGVGA